MKFKCFLLCIIFNCMILIFTINPAFCATYFVKNGGNDHADGLSDTNAWATIAKVNDYIQSRGFSNGDIIQFKRGDTWSNDEPLGYADGDVINWGTLNGLTIQDYGSGDLPWFNANTQVPIWIGGITNLTIKNIDASGYDNNYHKANIQISGCNGVTIDGVYIDGHKGTITSWNTLHSGITLANVDGDIEIKNSTILNMMGPTLRYLDGNPDANAIIITYRSKDGKPKLSGEIRVHDNTFHDVESDGMQLKGLHTTQYIYNNTIYNFGEQAIDVKINRYANIYNNDISRGSFEQGGNGGGGHIGWLGNHDAYPGYHSGDTNVYYNYIHDGDLEGFGFSGICSDINIHHNLVKNLRTGLTVSGVNNLQFHNNLIVMQEDYSCTGVDCSGIRGAIDSSSDNNKIYNNTFYIDNTTTKYGIAWVPASGATGNEIKNNIIQINRSSSDVYPLYIKDVTGEMPTLYQNDYYNPNHTNRIYWKSTTYNAIDLFEWQNVYDQGAIFSDPLFADPANEDFSLLQNSPCLLSDIILGADQQLYSLIFSQRILDAPKNLSIKIQ